MGALYIQVCYVGTGRRAASPVPRNRLLRREHLGHGVAHVRHDLDRADLAVCLEVDAVLGGNRDLLTSARNGALAVGKRPGEVHRHVVGDDDAVLLVALDSVLDLDVLAEVGERPALTLDLADQTIEVQTRLGLAEVGLEPGGDEPSGRSLLALKQGVEEGTIGGNPC